MSKYIIRSSTDQNNKERDNEDFKGVDYRRLIAIVADGISESGYGLQAAFRAVTEAQFQLRDLVDALRKGTFRKDDILPAIEEDVFKLTNDSMRGTTLTVQEYRRWGTTLDCCLVYEGVAYIGHVGDSRVYHLTGECTAMRQVTKDHVAPGDCSSKLAPRYEKIRALYWPISNHVGNKKDIFVDTHEIPLSKGDVILMVTDGYTKAISDKQLLQIVRESDFETQLRANMIANARHRRLATRYCRELKGCSSKNAYNILDDDRTFVAIKRIE